MWESVYIFCIGSIYYKMDPSRRAFQRILGGQNFYINHFTWILHYLSFFLHFLAYYNYLNMILNQLSCVKLSRLRALNFSIKTIVLVVIICSQFRTKRGIPPLNLSSLWYLGTCNALRVWLLLYITISFCRFPFHLFNVGLMHVRNASISAILLAYVLTW